MSAHPIYNFSAGPAVLPEAVLRTAQQEMLDYNGTGFPVMAMSHRSDMFLSILHHAEQDLRQLLNIPSNYKILFLQGGATTQFNMAAMNLAHGFATADAVVTGNWSRIAYEQMSRLSNAEIRLAAHGGEQYAYKNLPAVEDWDVNPNSAFVHFAINETVNGLQYQNVPKLSGGLPPLVCDMSSEILSREFDVSDYGLIYAGAQKKYRPCRCDRGHYPRGFAGALSERYSRCVQLPLSHQPRRYVQHAFHLCDLYVGFGVPLAANAGRCEKN